MSFILTELTADGDFDELVKVEFASFEQPYARLIRLFFPIFGDGSDARAAAMNEAVERQTRWHKQDPTSHWIKAVDSETGKIVGAAYWHVYKENPYATQSDEECTWFSPGEGREMANSLMGQFLTPRMKYMAKPHVFLDICFVHPDYRRRGIGRLLVEWGIKRADDMDFESYIDATEAGVPLYETYGYVKASRVDFSVSKADPSPQWEQLAGELLPFAFWPMWRPVGGKFEHNTTKHWERTI